MKQRRYLLATLIATALAAPSAFAAIQSQTTSEAEDVAEATESDAAVAKKDATKTEEAAADKADNAADAAAAAAEPEDEEEEEEEEGSQVP